MELIYSALYMLKYESAKMSLTCLAVVLAVFLELSNDICETTNIVETGFDVVSDMSPLGEPYLSPLCRSTVECATFCVEDPDCITSTAEQTDSRRLDCQLYCCNDALNTSSTPGVKLFVKKGKMFLFFDT